MLEDKNFSGQKKRFAVMLVVLVVSVAAALGVSYLFNRSDNAPKQQEEKTVPLSSEDKAAVSSVVESYIQGMGNFGVTDKFMGLSGQELEDARVVIQNNEADDNLFVSRQSAYMNNRDLINEGSPAFYDGSTVATFSSALEYSEIMQHKIGKVDASVPNKGFYLRGDNGKSIAVSVGTTFNEVVSRVSSSGDDYTWDGTYNVLQRSYDNVSLKIILVKTEEGWKVHEANLTENPYLLATWKNTDQDVDLHGFTKTGSIQGVNTLFPDGVPEDQN